MKVTSRRKFIAQSAIAAAGLAFTGCSAARKLFKDKAELAEEISALIEGEVLFDTLTLEAYSKDYGNIVTAVPQMVVFPVCVTDVSKTLLKATAWNVKVKVRGKGNSLYGQSLQESGLIIDLGRMPGSPQLANGELAVNSAITLEQAEIFLNGQGRAFRVLPGYLNVSVAGSLAHIGVSPCSIQHGHLVDSVVEFELVTGKGEVLECSNIKNQELFQSGLGTQGSLGVITKVRFGNLGDHRRGCYYSVPISGVDDYLEKLRFYTVTYREDIDFFLGWQFNNLTVGKYFTDEQQIYNSEFFKLKSKFNGSDLLYTDNFHLTLHQQMAGLNEEIPGFDLFKKAWAYYLYDLEGLKKLLTKYAQKLPEMRLDGRLAPSLKVIAVNNNRKSEFQFSPSRAFATGQTLYCAALLYNLDSAKFSDMAIVNDFMGNIQSICSGLGGVPYSFGWDTCDEQCKRTLFKEHQEELRALRMEHDPSGILNNTWFDS